MKLLIVLSIIAYGYADKLDRAYLPPSNAATAGGSPGSLLAPGVSSASGRQPGFGQTGQIGFGQTGQSGFGGTGQSGFGITGQPGLGKTDQIGFGQSGQSGIGQTSQPGFGQTGPSQPGFGQTVQSGIGQTGQSGFGQGIPSTPGLQPGYGSGPTRPSYGGVPGSAQSGPGYDSGIELGPGVTGSSAVAASGDINAQVNGVAGPSGSFQGQTFGSSPQPKAPFTQGFGQGTQDYNVAQAYKPERSQAAGDRNAEILKYINENDGEKYTYSYETSNGISAEETGEATNGVKAQGGFSYTGDDGQKYSLTYTADENGFLPQGDHLPTPHPIPAEILKSLEENARAAAAGTQEGAYRPEEYETEGSPQYNTGISSYNRPQGQIQGFGQGSSSPQGPTTNQGQNNQFSANQGGFAPNRLTGQSNQFGQPSQDSSKFTSGSVTPQGPNGYQQGLGASNQGTLDQFTGQGSVKQGLGQPSQQQGQGSSGYNYNQPQNTVGSVTQFGSGSDVQNRPQINGQGQISSVSGTRNGQGTFGLTTGNLPTSATSFEKSQGSRFESPTDISSKRPQNQLNGNAPSLSQPFQNTNQGSLGSSQGYQYQQNTNRPTFGNTNQPSGITSQPSQGSQYNANQKPIGANNGINQGTPQFASGTAGGQNIEQGQQNVNRPSFGGDVGSKQGSSSLYGVPNTGTGSTFGQANQSPFGSNSGPSQGSSQFGQGSQTFGSNGSVQGPSAPKGSSSIQAPYQYNRPTQSFPTQPQLPGSQGESSQYPSVKGPRPGVSAPGSQGASEQYPGISSLGPQGVNVQRPGQSSPGNQGVSGPRPGVNVPGIQVANGQYPGASSPGSQGVTVQRPDQSSNGNQPRPGAGASDAQSQYPGVSAGSQGIGQRPSSSSPGAFGRPGQGGQSGQEQFGGPRQPPSFNPQEGYKY